MEKLDQAATLRNFMDTQKSKTNIHPPPNNNIKNQAYPSRGTQYTKIITIASGKGGVGKTSLSVNLALSLTKMGKKVLLFDADLGLANVNILLGVIPQYNLYHVIKKHKTLQDIIIQTSDGVHLIPGASGYSILVDISLEEREAFFREFESIDHYDLIIFDTGAGVGQSVLGFTEAADETYIVTTPEPTAITDAYGIIKSILLQLDNPKISLIVNRVQSAFEGKRVANRIIHICKQFLNIEIQNAGFIYEDERVRIAVRKQTPFYTAFPKSKASHCISVLGNKIIGSGIPKDTQQNKVGNFFKKVFQNQ